MLKIEYRVRPVTRYIVTRFHSDYEVYADGDTVCVASRGEAGCETCGEFDNEDMAQRVAEALAGAEPEGEVLVNDAPIVDLKVEVASGAPEWETEGQ